MNRREACLSALGAWIRLSLASSFAHLACSTEQLPKEPDILTNFAFGSCNKQDKLQSHWPIIQGKKPQGWLWMGDSIYADKASPTQRAREYRRLLSDKGYYALARSGFILGTWDDHDYAHNDAGAEFEEREESKQIFLDFMGEDPESQRRIRPGVYDSRDIGKPENSVQFILLDMRFFKIATGINADPLGETQWGWLENEIRKPGPSLKILVSSIQALTDFTGKETWATFPDAQARLLRLIAESPSPLLILSGDRHLTEYSKRDLGNGRIVHEMTASGLTHFSDLANDNPFRVGEQLLTTNFGVMQLEWDTTQKAILRSLKLNAFSPQTGEQLSELIIPVQWG